MFMNKRVIKFRSWVNYEGESWMASWDLLSESPYFDFFNDDAIVMQYTGLNDSEGTEIYEGDLLEKKSGKTNHADGFTEVRWHGAGFGIFQNDRYVGWLGKDVANHSRVIGNIFAGVNET